MTDTNKTNMDNMTASEVYREEIEQLWIDYIAKLPEYDESRLTNHDKRYLRSVEWRLSTDSFAGSTRCPPDENCPECPANDWDDHHY